jgi:hypothetical protein
MAVYASVATLTKAELMHVLDGVADDAKIYVMASHAVIQMAVDGAKVAPRDAYFGLSRNTNPELGGIALVADFRPA